MLIVRPARLADLDALERMAHAAHPVLHSLPRDRHVLETRVGLSEDSFRAEVEFPGELLGTSSIVASAGYSEPFYAFRNDALIHALFGRDFEQVELELGGQSRTFIAEVMPSYPLYVPLLPPEAQRVLGEPDDGALLAYDIHLEGGFEPDRFVDIFDAGPVLTVAVDRSASVLANEVRAVRTAQDDTGASGTPYLIAAGGAHAFRCVLVNLPSSLTTGAPLSAELCKVLSVKDSDTVRYA
ncbi:Arginine N-succinyltransferase, alpha subunit [Candidatus Burkholderia crenata]|nr:Arginine N-succinyltransferase, alpha subunit [Candidatus Burkholderia crenata]